MVWCELQAFNLGDFIVRFHCFGDIDLAIDEISINCANECCFLIWTPCAWCALLHCLILFCFLFFCQNKLMISFMFCVCVRERGRETKYETRCSWIYITSSSMCLLRLDWYIFFSRVRWFQLLEFMLRSN